MISGFEIAAIITSIVATYPAFSKMHKDWQGRRRCRRKSKKNKELQALLDSSGDTIQNMFDEQFRKFGVAFARGDEITCSALANNLSIMKSTITPLFKTDTSYKKDALDFVIHPNHDLIKRLSTEAKRQTLTALVDQCQRLAQAAPIRRAPQQLRLPPAQPPPLLLMPPPSKSRYRSRSRSRPPSHPKPRHINDGYNCFRTLTSRTHRHRSRAPSMICNSCDWQDTLDELERDDILGGLPRTYDDRCLDWDCLWQKFHHVQRARRGYADEYRCFICQDGRSRTLKYMVYHIEDCHEWWEICDGYCADHSRMCGRMWRAG